MASATYVGEWRPHRPRGPIGAHFKSPGPKYMLPGTTGYTSHDAGKYRSPAFSFGTRHATYTNDCSPGPGYLVPSHITKTGIDGTPKYSLYGRHQHAAPFKNPGPGTYSPEKSGRSAHYSAPSYSLSGRMKSYRCDSSPGPGRYGIPPIPTASSRSHGLTGPAAYSLGGIVGRRPVSRQAAPSYSMTGRATVGSFHEDLKKTPGPGTYRVIPPGVYKNKGPFYSMTGRNMLPTDATRKPGPGAHSPEKMMNVRRSAPVYSFGMRHSEFISPLCMDPDY